MRIRPRRPASSSRRQLPRWSPSSAAREVVGFWLTERRSARQALTALAIYTGVGLAAGTVLGAMDGILADKPGLLVLIPAAISLRGAVFGTLGARLGTGMLTGQLALSRDRSSFTIQNVEAALWLTIVTSVMAAVVARAAAALFSIATIPMIDLVAISMLGSLVSGVLVFGVVIALALTAQRQQWDMDAIGAPIITAAGDITTLPALALAAVLVDLPLVAVVVGLTSLVGGVAAAVVGIANPGAIVRRVVRESLPVLTYMSMAGVLAGTVLQTRVSALVNDPALLVLIPPFIGLCGALGGILAARLASRLHLGLLTPRPLPTKPAALEGSLTLLLAFMAFSTIGVLTHLLAGLSGLSSPGLLRVVAIAVLGGLVAAVLLIGVAYYTAAASYRFGLDPDNYGLPVVSATMDFLGILCLIGAIGVVGLP